MPVRRHRKPVEGAVPCRHAGFAFPDTSTLCNPPSSAVATHARPYAFDRLSDEAAGRLSPCYHLRFERARALAAGGSFEVYAAWFKQKARLYPSRLFSLGENNKVFPFKTLNL